MSSSPPRKTAAELRAKAEANFAARIRELSEKEDAIRQKAKAEEKKGLCEHVEKDLGEEVMQKGRKETEQQVRDEVGTKKALEDAERTGEEESRQARRAISEKRTEETRKRKRERLQREEDEREAMERKIQVDNEARAQRVECRRLAQSRNSPTTVDKGKGKAVEAMEAGPSRLLKRSRAQSTEPSEYTDEDYTDEGETNVDLSVDTDDDVVRRPACFRCNLSNTKCVEQPGGSGLRPCSRCHRLQVTCMLSGEERTQLLLYELVDLGRRQSRWHGDISTVLEQAAGGIAVNSKETVASRCETTKMREEIQALASKLGEIRMGEIQTERGVGPSRAAGVTDEMEVDIEN